MPELNFENKTVLVTGATRGIGASIATAFLTAGAKVIGTGTHEASSGSFDEYFQADFTNVDQISACADYVRRNEPDVLINNAGIVRFGPLLEIALEDVQSVIDVNLRGSFLVAQSAAQAMQGSGGGVIINMTSIC